MVIVLGVWVVVVVVILGGLQDIGAVEDAHSYSVFVECGAMTADGGQPPRTGACTFESWPGLV